MADLPNLDGARAALANAMRPSWQIWCECGSFRGVTYIEPTETKARKECAKCRSANLEYVKQGARAQVDAAFLGDALAAVDALTARLAEAEANGRRKGLEEAAIEIEESGCDGPDSDPENLLTRREAATAIRSLLTKATP